MSEKSDGQRGLHSGDRNDRRSMGQDWDRARVWQLARTQQQRRLDKLRTEMEVLGLDWGPPQPVA
jgi:hypothetical protein